MLRRGTLDQVGMLEIVLKVLMQGDVWAQETATTLVGMVLGMGITHVCAGKACLPQCVCMWSAHKKSWLVWQSQCRSSLQAVHPKLSPLHYAGAS